MAVAVAVVNAVAIAVVNVLINRESAVAVVNGCCWLLFVISLLICCSSVD